MVWAVGKTLNNGTYRIQKVLGEGGFGVTYKVRHTRLGIDMVVKTPNDTLQADPEFPKYVQRFEREATILAKLKQVGHPHIVGVNDIFTEGQIPCLVMDFVEGVTLFDLVRDVGVLSPKEAVTYMEQIGSALIEVHGLPAVHRDAHPGNIMIPRRGFAKLIDFGIAGEVMPTQKISSKVFGHPKFAAPEQWRGNKHPRVDIFTLSASLFFALTGVPPEFDENDVLKPTAQGINPKVSNELNKLITDGLKVNRNERPQSMRDWLERLQKIEVVQGSGKQTPIRNSKPVFPRETQPTKVVVPQQAPQYTSTLEKQDYPHGKKNNVNRKRKQPVRVRGIRTQKDNRDNLLVASQPLDSFWKILRFSFWFWAGTGYLWQTVDMQYGVRLLFYIWAENFRNRSNAAMRSAIMARLGDFTWIDATGKTISGLVAGLVTAGGGFLIIRLCFLEFDMAMGLALAVALVGAFAGALVGAGTLTFAFAFAWAFVFIFAVVGAGAFALTVALAEEYLQQLEKYSLRECILLLSVSWIAGGLVGWLLYQLMPLFYIDLPSGESDLNFV